MVRPRNQTQQVEAQQQENTRGRQRRTRQRPPSPPPPPPPQVESESDGEGENDVLWGKIIRPGMYIDVEELSGTPLIQLLNAMNLTLFASFESHWYPQLVDEFYQNFRRTANGINFLVGGVRGVITVSDFVSAFNMTASANSVSEYPQKKWSTQWPLDMNACVASLNNGHQVKKEHLAYKYNLTGIQKLVFKVVSSIIMPTNNQASELSIIHTFLTCAILNGVAVNWPLMIMKHMDYQKEKRPFQYGMIISHLLVNNKNVPVDDRLRVKVKRESKIGTHSLISQELYMWEDILYAKWEIFQRFANVRDQVWRSNGCPPPAPPKNWIPNDDNIFIVMPDQPEPPLHEPPRHEPPFEEPPLHEPQFSHAGEASSSRSSLHNMTDRELMESMYNSITALRLDQERMRYDQTDYQWRHMSFMHAVSERLDIQDTYGFLFSGYQQPETGTSSRPPAEDPMDDETQD